MMATAWMLSARRRENAAEDSETRGPGRKAERMPRGRRQMWRMKKSGEWCVEKSELHDTSKEKFRSPKRRKPEKHAKPERRKRRRKDGNASMKLTSGAYKKSARGGKSDGPRKKSDGPRRRNGGKKRRHDGLLVRSNAPKRKNKHGWKPRKPGKRRDENENDDASRKRNDGKLREQRGVL